MRHADREYADWLDNECATRWLRGFSIEAIAAGLDITRRRVNQFLAPHRKLLAKGGYDAELAKLAAEGITNLPTAETASGRPGRPPHPLTDDEQAMRAEYVAGKRIAVIAREHSTYTQRVRAVLMKKPSVLNT
jgi:hypothetical protein